jgi:hypothetical protein
MDLGKRLIEGKNHDGRGRVHSIVEEVLRIGGDRYGQLAWTTQVTFSRRMGPV